MVCHEYEIYIYCMKKSRDLPNTDDRINSIAAQIRTALHPKLRCFQELPPGTDVPVLTEELSEVKMRTSKITRIR